MISPREESPSEWLSRNIVRLAREITNAHFSAHPESEERYGTRGRMKCEEDAAYHLHFLAEAIAANSKKIFIDYTGWAKIMLASRAIDVHDLEEGLRTMAAVLQRESTALHPDVFDLYVRSALDALPALPATIPTFISPEKPFSDVANAYLKSLLVLDRELAISTILQRVSLGLSVQDLFQHVFFPVQQEVGRLWQENKITVVQEHYCTAATSLLIVKLRRGFIGTLRQVSALAVCAEGEEHCLGLKMLSELLESDGWKVNYLEGKSNPDVFRYLESNRIDLVAISSGTAMNLSKVRQLISGIRDLPPKPGPRILVGGTAIASDPNIWRNLGADGFASSVIDGLEEANRLVGLPG